MLRTFGPRVVVAYLCVIALTIAIDKAGADEALLKTLADNSPWIGEWKSSKKNGTYELIFTLNEETLSARVDKDKDHSHKGADGPTKKLEAKNDEVKFTAVGNGAKFSLKYDKDEGVLQGKIRKGSRVMSTVLRPSS